MTNNQDIRDVMMALMTGHDGLVDSDVLVAIWLLFLRPVCIRVLQKVPDPRKSGPTTLIFYSFSLYMSMYTKNIRER